MAIYYRSRRRRRSNRGIWLLMLVAALAAASWWIFLYDETPDSTIAAGPDATQNTTPPPALPVTEPETAPQEQPIDLPRRPSETPEKILAAQNANPPAENKPARPPARKPEPGPHLAAAKKAMEQGDLLTARREYSTALSLGLAGAEASLVRAELTRIGNETIFSPRVLPDDPLAERYVIKAGDSLGKIAGAFRVSADLLARINGIANKNLIRAGQNIKVVKGPFHARVSKPAFGMDILLGDAVVRHFPVGLGADDSTPTGTWQVGTKLVNPTYYPPRGGKIMAADDPENPLGEHWIGLIGISGEAIGQQRYGIHGTIEPDSIGRDVSLGCIRLHNRDVEIVYELLMEKHSTVLVLAD